MLGIVNSIVDETNDTKTFICQIPKHQPALRFISGQYSTFRFLSAPDALKHECRCYSFSQPLIDPYRFQFTVRMVPDGRISSWVCNALAVGDTIELTKPRGHFVADSEAQHLLLFASGSGITPIKCIIEDLLWNTDKRITLFFACKNEESAIFFNEIKALKKKNASRFSAIFHYYDCFGFPSLNDIDSVLAAFPADQIMLCGAEKFMASVEESRRVSGLSYVRLSREDYGLSGSADKPDLSEEMLVQLKFTYDDRCEEIHTSNAQSLLVSIKNAGFNPPHSCEEGYCGTCIAKLEGGKVHVASSGCLDDDEIAEGWILTCQSYAKSRDVVIHYRASEDAVSRDSDNDEAGKLPLGNVFQYFRKGAVSAQSKIFMLIVGLALTSVPVLAAFYSPTHLGILNPGPMTKGHENLTCVSCHREEDGTVRQQLQGKIGYWGGERQTEPDLLLKAVSSEDCLACHKRPNDRHPINRFREPRFVDALEVVDARSCLSCHTEHVGKRLTANDHYCVACHKELVVKNDPVDMPHAKLIKLKQWSSCLGCHDFHNNHKRKAQKVMTARISAEDIKRYFTDGPDPYAKKKMYKAKEERK